MAFVVRATSTLAGWSTNPIRQQMGRALQLYRPVLREQLKREIQKPQFAWPRATRRKGPPKRTVTTPRDIVDSGDFLASQVDYQPDPLILRYQWGGNGGPVDYAGVIRKGKPNYPSRDWITPAFREQPLRRFIAANWQRARRSVPLTPRR